LKCVLIFEWPKSFKVGLLQDKTMSKRSSKKGSLKRVAAETTLIPHRTPNLTDLLERAKRGKLVDVEQYLRAGGSPNVLTGVQLQPSFEQPPDRVLVQLGGETQAPLLTSIAVSRQRDAAASIKLLLKAGAAVDAISPNTGRRVSERTALMVACSFPSNLKPVKALLQGGADPCYQASSDGVSALHLAATAGCTETCRVLHTASAGRALALRGKGEGLNATPLSAACLMGHSAVVKLLCTLGADVNHASVTGEAPLAVAASSEEHDTSILEVLLQQDGIDVNHHKSGGDTALMTAAYVGNVAVVKLLLQYGADARSINHKGESAALYAVRSGHLHVLKLLTVRGADVTAATGSGCTLLMQSATSNQPHVAEYLISKGVPVTAVDRAGSTALHCAAGFTSTGTETMRVLLAHGADVNAANSCGTPLHVVASSGQLDRLEVLMAAGADVARTDASGGTALHAAVLHSCAASVKLLLEHGAGTAINNLQCNMCTCCGRASALMVCTDTAVLKLLLTAGADVHVTTSSVTLAYT
jgi:uncharacterized protein